MISFKKYIMEEIKSSKKKMYEVPSFSGKSKIKTDIPPEKRELTNLPRTKDGKAKVRFQDWLELNNKKGANGKYYGWSHRAIYGFKKGMIMKKGDTGLDPNRKVPYKIKDEDDAKKHAKRFGEEVS